MSENLNSHWDALETLNYLLDKIDQAFLDLEDRNLIGMENRTLLPFLQRTFDEVPDDMHRDDERFYITHTKKDVESNSSQLSNLGHLISYTYTCPECDDKYVRYRLGSSITLNASSNNESVALSAMLETFFENSDEISKECRLMKCPKKQCPGRAVNSDMKILPGPEYFIISINRVAYEDEKYIRLRTDINVPLRGLRLAGYAYNLAMVMHQVAWDNAEGEEDPHNGHYYVHKRVTYDNDNFWVLLDDDNIIVLEEMEMANIIKEQSKSIVMLIYRKELSYFNDYSTSTEKSISDLDD